LGDGTTTNKSTPVLVAPSLAAPIIDIQPASQAVPNGLNVTFTIGIGNTGYPLPTCQWQISTNDSAWTNISSIP
jgi:hypothetical protein